MPDDQKISPGSARCPGTSWEEVMAGDAGTVPDFLLRDEYRYMGSEPIAAARYTSPEFFRREIEKMWPRVWQFAARDEEMPDPGDFVVYENAGRSYLISRQDDGSLTAFHNVCLHRGRKLRLENGSTDNFTCPFHGFSWNKDGSFRQMPCSWDFPHLGKHNLELPKAAVDSWGGYIFIREDLEGPTLLEYLDPLPEFFARWRHEECVTAIWVAKVIPANWKATAEAFMEAWHTLETHPQILPFTGDANSRYNVYGDNVNGAFTPFGVMSPHIDPAGKGEQWVADELLKYNSRIGDGKPIHIPEGQTARQTIAAANRIRFEKMFGHNLDHASDAELLDALVYNVFPNFAPWGGFMPNLVYRWRPWPDEKHTLMEVRHLRRVPPGTPRPRAVDMHMLGPDEPWTAAEELMLQGSVFQQDSNNLPFVQAGLEVSKNGLTHLGDYQDIRVRHFHRTLDKYLGEL